MRHGRFGEWTRDESRAESRVERAGLRKRRTRSKVLAAFGCTLMIFAVLFFLTSLQTTSEGEGGVAAQVPKNGTLRLTVPKMKRVNDIPVYTASSDNGAALDAGAVHVKGTGFPWQENSNVYIAGHRLGYPNTRSFLLFYDLNKLADGDKVVLSDSGGTRYVYRVFREITVDPNQVSVTKPVAGKEIVSLQSCTLPDYSRRLIVQAELIDTVNPKDPSKKARVRAETPSPATG